MDDDVFIRYHHTETLRRVTEGLLEYEKIRSGNRRVDFEKRRKAVLVASDIIELDVRPSHLFAFLDGIDKFMLRRQ